MDTIQLLVDFGFVGILMVVGAWLETINGKHGIFDELLTPLPMGVAGMFVIAERVFA